MPLVELGLEHADDIAGLLETSWGSQFATGSYPVFSTRYLRWLFDRYGDWPRTLAAYNAGPQAVDRYDGVPPYEETREYVQRVLSYYRRFHDDFAR